MCVVFILNIVTESPGKFEAKSLHTRKFGLENMYGKWKPTQRLELGVSMFGETIGDEKVMGFVMRLNPLGQYCRDEDQSYEKVGGRSQTC